MSGNKKRRNSNVIKLNRAARFNSTIIIFGIILIYVIASIFISLSKEPITTYKVGSSNINNNINCTGIALRNEIEITSGKSGYMIYFVHDGDKTKKNSPVCTVDETGNVITAIKEAGDSDDGNTLFTDSDYAHIRSTIDTYKSSYSDVTFSNLYNFKSEIESKVMELSSEVMMQEINAGGAQVSSTLQTIKATESGVVTYYIDGYEKKTPETLSEEDFNKANYKKTSLKSGDILDTGSTVFKIVSDENWNIVCQITKEQAKVIQEEEKLRFTINNSPNEVSSTFNLIEKEDCYFLVLPLSKYMVDYIDERFLSIEIILNKFEGLKVPNSSLIDKEVYMIPKSYVPEDERSNVKTVKVIRYEDDKKKLSKDAKADEATPDDATLLDATLGNASMTDAVTKSTVTDAKPGEPRDKTVELIVYKIDEEYYYVDEDAFYDTDQIYTREKGQTIPVVSLKTTMLTGVYLANTGVANFTEVTIVKSQDEFTILKDDENLKEFDNIVLDAEQVRDNQNLY